QQLQPTEVETLLVSGTVDFTTPAQVATDELLPALPNGHQVILAEFGHTTDFWTYQPEAGQRLLTAFFGRGVVDDTLYERREIDLTVGSPSMPMIARVLFGTMAGLALLTIALLGWMAHRARRRGGFRPRTGAWLRVLAPVPVGLGGWFI